jgi:hypothetical protein
MTAVEVSRTSATLPTAKRAGNPKEGKEVRHVVHDRLVTD